MPKRPDADLSVSDIGVNSILDAAGLGDTYDSVPVDGPAPISELGSNLGFGSDADVTEERPNRMSETEFARALDSRKPLIPNAPTHTEGLSDIDSAFFAPAMGENLWEVPGERSTEASPRSNPDLLVQLGQPAQESEQTDKVSERPSTVSTVQPDLTSSNRETVFRADSHVMSQLPHFELELPQDELEQTVILPLERKTGLPDAEALLVEPEPALKSTDPDQKTVPSASVQDDGTPDEVSFERPTGAAALVAGIIRGEE